MWRSTFAGLAFVIVGSGAFGAWLPVGVAEEPAHATGSTPPTPVTDSQDPSAHLNYATILFYTARQQMTSGDQTASTATFKVVESELLRALELSDQQPDGVERRLLRSQSAFMLGDLNLVIFNDREKAKTLYQQSLEQVPDHQGASAALKRLQ